MFTYHRTTTEYSCGIDLHSRMMYICVMDKDGNILVHRNIKGNSFEYFLSLVEPYLKYAFHEAAVLGKGRNPEMRKYYQRLKAKKGKFLANSILACKYARAVYYMLKNKKVFEFSKLARRAA